MSDTPDLTKVSDQALKAELNNRDKAALQVELKGIQTRLAALQARAAEITALLAT